MAVTCPAVAAVAADDVALAADPLANGVMMLIDPGPQSNHFPHVFMADHHGRMDMLLAPGIPIVDVYVRTADGGFADLNQHFADPGGRDRNLGQPKAGTGFGFDQCVHHLLHRAALLCPRYTDIILQPLSAFKGYNGKIQR